MYCPTRDLTKASAKIETLKIPLEDKCPLWILVLSPTGPYELNQKIAPMELQLSRRAFLVHQLVHLDV